MLAFLSTPIDSHAYCLGSLASNRLCGLDECGDGTYTAEGINKLCEGLKGSAVTPEYSLSCQRPLTPLTAPTSVPVLAVCDKTTSVPKEELLSRRVSRVTRRCSRWSRLPGIEPAPECLLMCQRH